MAISLTQAAFATVAVTGIVLFGIGTPATRTPAPEPTPTARVASPPAAPAAPAPTTATAAGITLRSVDFELPTGEPVFPGGAKAEAINSNCVACHSPGMVLTQPKLTEAAWHEEVEKMRTTYKAPVAEEAVPAIVAYLAALPSEK